LRLLLFTFLLLRLLQQAAEHAILALNRRWASDPARRAEAARLLRIPPAEMEAAAAYAADRQRFQLLSGWTEVLATLAFLAAGGLSWAEGAARSLGRPLGLGPVGRGLLFLGTLGAAGALFDLPFALYNTFRIEEKHGFNRQTLRGFFADLAKGLALAIVLGGAVLGALLAIMERAGGLWWVWAWLAVGAFTVLTAWIHPTLLAPLFNRFTPLPEGELRERILELLRRIGFRASGLVVMDASRRTAHGNAYFTGLFRAKRIVLFDTLLEAMNPREVVAVLAHELGHFKLHHVRTSLLRRLLKTGALLYALSLCLPWTAAYAAFGLSPSNAGALVVFGLWLGLAQFLLQPLERALSRRQEFAADAFAVESGAAAKDLGEALLRLRERSRLLPLAHPLYSGVYHSHPPLLERLRAMGAV
jgi:STE24 endopeptidase